MKQNNKKNLLVLHSFHVTYGHDAVVTACPCIYCVQLGVRSMIVGPASSPGSYGMTSWAGRLVPVKRAAC
jgi:hypothetical protein